ncbi:MAG TPA: cytochrome c [Bryobacteraceae bacterium]|nr:cytochrome c [Bryobacteraceae bacterium]
MKVRMIAIAAAAFGALGLSAADLPGKAVYENTCQFCHGAEGAGSGAADTFWKLRIPRLNSPAVQNKSDEHLDGIILHGVRRMAPVRMGTPSSPHRSKLTPEQRKDVLAYVRSFAKKP